MRKCLIIIFFGANIFCNMAFSQSESIVIQLNSMKEGAIGCKINWIITNKTGLNITAIEYETRLIEADGSIIDRMMFYPDRLKSGVNTDYQSNAINVPCKKIKSIKFNGIPLLLVDGSRINRATKEQISDSTILTSKMGAVILTR